MFVRAYVTCVVFLAITARTQVGAQDAVLYLDVSNQSAAPENLELPRPYNPELREDLLLAQADALSLYTEFAGRAGTDLANFLTNFTSYAERTLRNVEASYGDDQNECRLRLATRLKKIEHDAKRAATYSGDSHHKFILGHMVVFRMHLNKSEDYITKCDNIVRGCGQSCESTPRVKRWLRLAAEEINRVRDDMHHSRRSYRDLVSHARRKLNHLRKIASARTSDAIQQYRECLRG